MVKKMGLTSIFKVIIDPTRFSSSSSSSSFSTPPSPPSWTWASCKSHPRTLSFRVTDQEVYKTVKSVYFDQCDQSCLSHSPSPSPSPAVEHQEHLTGDGEEDETNCGSEECITETVIQGLRSERLFFETGVETSSILMEKKVDRSTVVLEEDSVPFKESVAEEMESENPMKDFRVSMEEMVVAHGLKDWECLEELLEWYLRMNGKNTHGFILGAFVDLLLDLAFFFPSLSPPPFSCGCSYSSSSCFCTCSSPTTTATSSSSSAKFVVN